MAIRARSGVRPRVGTLDTALPQFVATGSGAASNPQYTGSLIAVAPGFQAAGLGAFTAGGGGEPGDLVHGEEFTISGSGFGARPDYNFDGHEWQGARHIHYRWSDFSSPWPANGSNQAAFQAAMGGLYPAGLWEFSNNPSSIGVTRQAGGPSQSGHFFQKTSTAQGQTGYLMTTQGGAPIPDSADAYICYKARINGNGKVIRWWNDGGGSPNWHWGAQGIITREPPNNFDQWIGSSPLSSSQFRRVEHLLGAGDSSRIWVNGSLLTYTGSGPYQGQSTLPLMSGQTHRTSLMSWPNSVDNGDTFAYTDIYFDFTPARVEVTVGSATEIQILSSWADGKIVGRFNKGAMSSGAGTIRVYNASNAVIHSEPCVVA